MSTPDIYCSILGGTIRVRGVYCEGGGLLRGIARLNTAQLKTDLDRNSEGQGDLVTRLIMGIIGGSIWVIGVVTLLTKSP